MGRKHFSGLSSLGTFTATHYVHITNIEYIYFNLPPYKEIDKNGVDFLVGWCLVFHLSL